MPASRLAKSIAVRSPNSLATIWMPTGSPLGVRPIGATAAGTRTAPVVWSQANRSPYGRITPPGALGGVWPSGHREAEIEILRGPCQRTDRGDVEPGLRPGRRRKMAIQRHDPEGRFERKDPREVSRDPERTLRSLPNWKAVVSSPSTNVADLDPASVTIPGRFRACRP